MTDKERELLNRINAYAEQTLGDIDPQTVLVSKQLDTLRPVLETIAAEENKSLEDIFILYMDLQSEASLASQTKLEESLRDLNEGGDMPLLFR